MSEGHPEVAVVELVSGLSPQDTADIALFDAFAARNRGEDDIVRLLDDPRCLKVVMYTWNVQAAQVDQAFTLGCTGICPRS